MRISMKKKQGFYGFLEGEDNRIIKHKKMENEIRKLQIKRNVSSSRKIF